MRNADIAKLRRKIDIFTYELSSPDAASLDYSSIIRLHKEDQKELSDAQLALKHYEADSIHLTEQIEKFHILEHKQNHRIAQMEKELEDQRKGRFNQNNNYQKKTASSNSKFYSPQGRSYSKPSTLSPS